MARQNLRRTRGTIEKQGLALPRDRNVPGAAFTRRSPISRQFARRALRGAVLCCGEWHLLRGDNGAAATGSPGSNSDLS